MSETGKQQDYDFVIIGSGMGGMACAVILAKEGYKVCILEKNNQIGGTLQTFSRDKRIFDSGVHYVGGLEPGQNMHQLFSYLGIMDKIRIAKMDENAYDTVVFEGDPKEYHYAQGYDRLIRNLVADFPDEVEAIQKYCDTIREICQKFPMYNLRSGNYMDTSVLELETKSFLESITSNKKLQNVLGGTNLLYAGQPGKTPFYVHALIINSYTESAYRFINGGSQIARYLAREITSRGGVIIKHAQVTNLQEIDGTIVYAETDEGKKYYGKSFISNIHPVKTLELTNSDRIKKAYRNRIKSLENSISTFYVNVVLKKDCFPYRNTNEYIFTKEDAWSALEYTEENWPQGYAIFYSTAPNQGPYAEAVTIMCYMNFADVERWAGTFNTAAREQSRGEDYEAYKVMMSEKIFDAVSRRYPNFRDCIYSYTAATPLTARDYIGTDDGSLYGFTKDYRDPMRSFISPKTKIPNLYLTGQNLNLHGILGVTVSAVVTCSEILGRDYLLEKINNA